MYKWKGSWIESLFLGKNIQLLSCTEYMTKGKIRSVWILLGKQILRALQLGSHISFCTWNVSEPCWLLSSPPPWYSAAGWREGLKWSHDQIDAIAHGIWMGIIFSLRVPGGNSNCTISCSRNNSNQIKSTR